MTFFTNARLNESYTVERLSSGLTLILYPMPAFRNTFAGIAAPFGSMDRSFAESDGSLRMIPDGTAHFLEHKLFESADGDAFEQYAKTGASANAYTSFTHTNYHFSCTDHFAENLRILLGFVSSPWFTAETIAKEQEIIGQEIEMYADDPDWQGCSMLLSALYGKVPLGADIAGSRESISQITPALLYDCYRAFYAPDKLTLVAAGRFDPNEVRSICETFFSAGECTSARNLESPEPRETVQTRKIQRMSVALPQFFIGFKERSFSAQERAIRPVMMELLLDMLASDVSPLYRRLYDGGLVNDVFSSEVMTFREHCSILFSGESRNPERVFEALCDEFDRARREGLDRRAFERSRRAIYARQIRRLASPESAASFILSSFYANGNIYDIIERTASAQFQDVEALLSEILDRRYASMSVILPQDEFEGEN